MDEASTASSCESHSRASLEGDGTLSSPSRHTKPVSPGSVRYNRRSFLASDTFMSTDLRFDHHALEFRRIFTGSCKLSWRAASLTVPGIAKNHACPSVGGFRADGL